MSLNMKKTICFALLLALSLSLFACSTPIIKSDEKKIEDCIESFTNAYNDGDVEEALKYMTGKNKNAVEAALKIVGMFTGYDAYEIFASVFSLGVATSDGDFMKVEIIEIEIDGDTATVTCDLSFPGAYSSESETSYFHMKKVDRNWFISNITD